MPTLTYKFNVISVKISIGSFMELDNLKLKFIRKLDFPGGAVVRNPPANAGDMGSSPGPGRSHMPQTN